MLKTRLVPGALILSNIIHRKATVIDRIRGTIAGAALGRILYSPPVCGATQVAPDDITYQRYMIQESKEVYQRLSTGFSSFDAHSHCMLRLNDGLVFILQPNLAP